MVPPKDKFAQWVHGTRLKGENLCCEKKRRTTLGHTSYKSGTIPFCTSCVRIEGLNLICMGDVTCVMKRRGR